MSCQWRFLLFLWICVGTLGGCQTSGDGHETLGDRSTAAPLEAHSVTADDEEPMSESSEPFRPYAYTEVPELKTLVFAEGFKEYATERPYLLGYSYDGEYAATIIYDAEEKGYIVEVNDTLINRVAYEAFVPDEERILNGEQVSIDLLATAQESLDMGYRIKVAPVVHETGDGVFEKRGAEDDVFRFQISVEEDSLFRIAVHDENGHTWHVVSDGTPLHTDQQLVHNYMWAIHPQVPDRVNVMAYTAREGQAVTPYVYTINTAALDPSMSEQSLKQALSEWLENPKIVYRFPSTANARSVLGVEAEGEKKREGAFLYAAEVTEFVLLDKHGDERIRAGGEGVFYKGDPLAGTDGGIVYYDIALIQGKNKDEAELFVADAYDRNGKLVQTIEWRWSEREGQFQLIQAEET